MRKQQHGWVVGLSALVLVAAAAATAEWHYYGEHGPEHWGEDYPDCNGMAQSPIDVIPADAVFGQLPELTLEYNSIVDLQVENNGHTVQANVPPGSAFLTVGSGNDAKEYELLQFHWHTASEHYLNGNDYPLEMHLVHRAADNTLGVVGFFIRRGEEHAELAKIFDNLPTFPAPMNPPRFPYLPTKNNFDRNEAAGATDALVVVPDFDLQQLVPTLTARQQLVRRFVERLPQRFQPFIPKPPFLESYRYDGSLTTPSCAEGVKWHVMAYQVEMSNAQIRAFREMFFTDGTGEFPDGNRRPLQELNGRTVATDVPRLPL